MKNKDNVLQNLSGDDLGKIQEAASIIKIEGDSDIIPDLFALLKNPNISHSSEFAIATLLAEYRDPLFPNILKEEIENSTDSTYQAKLIRICWESVANFSVLIPTLIDILLTGDLLTAIEAATAIEEQLHHADENMYEYVEDALKEYTSGERTTFIEPILETISILREENAEEIDEEHEHHHHEDGCTCDECKS